MLLPVDNLTGPCYLNFLITVCFDIWTYNLCWNLRISLFCLTLCFWHQQDNSKPSPDFFLKILKTISFIFWDYNYLISSFPPTLPHTTHCSLSNLCPFFISCYYMCICIHTYVYIHIWIYVHMHTHIYL